MEYDYSAAYKNIPASAVAARIAAGAAMFYGAKDIYFNEVIGLLDENRVSYSVFFREGDGATVVRVNEPFGVDCWPATQSEERFFKNHWSFAVRDSWVDSEDDELPPVVRQKRDV